MAEHSNSEGCDLQLIWYLCMIGSFSVYYSFESWSIVLQSCNLLQTTKIIFAFVIIPTEARYFACCMCLLVVMIVLCLFAIVMWWVVDLVVFVQNGRNDGVNCPLLADL